MKRGEFLENSVLFLVLVAVAATVAYYTYFWQWNFNSDTVVSALAAQRLLSHGEVPIFVGGMGYQGLILEVPLIAASFSLFGMSSYSFNLVPTLFYLFLLFAFYRVCRLSFDRLTSRLALLFLALSPAQWFAVVMRSIPNYPQTYLSGLVLFLIYADIVKSDRNRRFQVLAFGALAGFAFYTYGQIIYFFAAILLHASLFYFRDRYAKSKSLRTTFLPREGLPTTLLLCVAFLFFIAAWIPWGGAKIGRSRIDFISCLFVSVSALGLLHGVVFFRGCGRQVWKVRGLLALGAAAFLVGYFPKVYYNVFLGLPSMQKLHIGGDLAMVWFRLGLLKQSLIECYALSNPISAVAVFCSLFLCLGWFLWNQWQAALKFIRSEISVSAITQVSFGLPLFLCTFSAVMVSAAFADLSAHRYAFALFMPLAMAFAYTCRAFFPLRRGGAVVACFLAFAILLQSVRSYRQGEVYLRNLKDFAAIAKSLRTRGVNAGYADYWYGYSLDFLFPDLFLKPLYGNYVPYADEKVAKANRIALVEPSVPEVQMQGKHVLVDSQKFLIEESYSVAGRNIYILKRN